MNILFEKPKQVVTVDYTDTFIDALLQKGIKSIKVGPLYVIEQLKGNSTGEISTHSTSDIEYVIDQLVNVNPELVLVREVRKETRGGETKYIVRIDYIKIEG
ncbi:hypothetical protein [Enterobacteria phage vB_EcoM_IME540]|uniref:Uncharacterized protein n=1 Tax=Enterobacteria phage vB_EcoM_IME281 TaxID=2163887 RepID=A0A2S1GNW2_9CAUD|nr:hypothetical protein KNT84_gp062 [Enterobacteria phage vB_EcoM_IME281]AWD91072.1 hypothetical protein [Enterobacteria phage vB_EcoM_IME281]QJA42477.1 hypothetical protein [Enterobacteria phage vB_EcoM_IME540]UCR81215.1 hypothetical protein PSD2002_0099 [Escherichia phage PSD2002]WPJ21593.1 hypothetical protein [Salmonella phage vB_SalD_ABTNLS3]